MKCSIKGCNKQAKVFMQELQLCRFHWEQICKLPYQRRL